MYILVIYDARPQIGQRLCKLLRKHLNWIQNSVFEGEVTKAKLNRICAEIRKIIDNDLDSVIVYVYLLSPPEKIVLGVEKAPVPDIII
jgi:CRISPR-associated protein Cas2